MDQLANSILASEAFFAYLILPRRLVRIYATFVDVASASSTMPGTYVGVSD
jgi:hypothetical protein